MPRPTNDWQKGKSRPQIPRIIVVGSNELGALEGAYLRALIRTGLCQAELFDTDRLQFYLPGQSVPRRLLNRAISPIWSLSIRAKLIQFLSAKAKSYDAVVVFKGAELSRRTLEICRSIHPRAVWANYNPDDPLNTTSKGSTNSHIIDSLSFYDLYFTWSRRVARKLKEHGCKGVAYLPFGYDPDFHCPPSKPVTIIPGRVTFVGAWDPEREAILTEFADYDLRVFGNNWGRVRKCSPLYQKIVPHNIYGEDLSKVMFSSSVCLNLLRPQNAGAHNMRTFEIPAMGGLMLTTRSGEQNEFFPEEEGCFMFSDVRELRKQLGRVISNEGLARRVRARCSELVSGHSYTQRAGELLRMICDLAKDLRLRRGRD